MNKIIIVSILLICLFFSSCVLNKNSAYIDTSYKLLSLMKDKNYEEIKNLLSVGLLYKTDEQFKREIDRASELLRKHGLPEKDSLIVTYEDHGDEESSFTIVTYPIYNIKYQDKLKEYAEIIIHLPGNWKGKKVAFFFVHTFHLSKIPAK